MTRLDDEIRAHLELLEREHRARGLSPQEAREAARRDFGGVEQMKEVYRDQRGLRWLADLRQDLGYALRLLGRTRGFTAVAILILALGIGVNTALFTIVRQVLLTTLPVPNPEEIVEIDCGSGDGATGGRGSCMHSYPAFRLLSERHEGLAGIVAFSPVPNGLIASSRGTRDVITGQVASANMFDVLGIIPAAGRLLREADDRPGAEPVAVLSYGYWLRGFGSQDEIIGETLTLNGRAVTVVGVLPQAFRGVTFGESYDVVLPLGTADLFVSPGILSSGNRGWLTFLGRRQGAVPVEAIATRLEPVFRQSIEEAIAPIPLDIREQLNLRSEGIRVNVRPAAFGAASNVRRTLEPTLGVLAVVVVLVLLIACANLAGLFLGQAINRQREFGLRLALGAGRSRLLRQVFTESLLLAAAGGALGLLLAQWVTPAAFTLATDDTGLRAVDLRPDRWMLAFTAALSVLAAVMVSSGSVLRVSAAYPQEALRNLRGPAAPRLTRTILVTQIALTLALVGSAALLLQTLTNFRRIDLGFQPDQLITVAMDAGLGTFERPRRASEYVRQAAAALEGLPGVRAVTYANRAMGTGVGMILELDVPEFTGAGGNASSSGMIYAGPRFARTLGLTLLAGRDFDATDREGSDPVAIVNESFATHFFGTANAVGRRFALRGPDNPPILVAGVVKDARDGGVKRNIQRIMYLPFGHREVNRVTFTVRADGAAASLAEIIRRTLERVEPAVGVARMTTVDAQLDDTLRRERLLAALGGAFAGLALLLLAVGLYGMLNAMVARRTTEIGVRMALGATRGGIVWMLAREALLVVAAGVALGIAGYAAAGRLIQSELFGVEAADPAVAAAAVAALVLVAAAAVWLPARRATRVEPAQALRYDHA